MDIPFGEAVTSKLHKKDRLSLGRPMENYQHCTSWKRFEEFVVLSKWITSVHQRKIVVILLQTFKCFCLCCVMA